MSSGSGIPSAGALNTRRWEKLAIFDGNRCLSGKWCGIGRWLLYNVNVMGAGSNGIIFDDLEGPVTRVSRSLYTYKSNISITVHFIYIFISP